VKTPGTFRVARPGDVIVHYGPRQRPTTGELPTKWNGGGNIKLAVTDFIEFQLRSSHGDYNLNPEILEMCFTPSDASISCTLESDTFCSAESMWLLVNGSTWMGAGIAILIVGFLWVFVWDYTTTPPQDYLLTTWDYITANDFWCVGMAKLKAQVDGYTRTELIGACKKAGVRPLNGTSAVMRGQLIKRVRSGGIEIIASMIFGVVFLVHQVFNMAWASFGWVVTLPCAGLVAGLIFAFVGKAPKLLSQTDETAILTFKPDALELLKVPQDHKMNGMCFVQSSCNKVRFIKSFHDSVFDFQRDYTMPVEGDFVSNGRYSWAYNETKVYQG